MNIAGTIRTILLTDVALVDELGGIEVAPNRIVIAWNPTEQHTYPVLVLTEVESSAPKVYLNGPSNDRVTRIGVSAVTNAGNAGVALNSLSRHANRILDGVDPGVNGGEFIGSIRAVDSSEMEAVPTDDARDVTYYAAASLFDVWHYLGV